MRTRKDADDDLRDPRVVHPADVSNTLISEVLVEWPAIARVFIDRRMACVGCPFAHLETVAEAAAAYGIGVRELAADLAAARIASEE